MNFNITRLGEIYKESYIFCKENSIEFHILPHLFVEYQQLRRQLRQLLISNPGTLVYIGNDDTAIGAMPFYEIWRDILSIEEEDVEDYDELIEDTHSVGVIEDAIERSKIISPQFIFVNPNILNFNRYYEQAVRAYIYDLNNASLIIICSFLETALKEKLSEYKLDAVDLKYEIDDKGNRYPVGVCSKFTDQIDKCYAEDMITREDKDKLHKIRKLRNDAVHEGKAVPAEQILESINDMKSIFENLFREDEV